MKSDINIIWLQETLVSLFWCRIPTKAYRYSRLLALLLTDGLYLTAWPRVSGFIPAAAVLAGFLFGWRHPGDTFTFSLEGMGILLAMGCVGSALAIYAWVGYVFGDFLLAQSVTDWMSRPDWIQLGLTVRLPMMFSYALLAALIVFIPMIAQNLRQQSTPGFLKAPSLPSTLYAAILQATLQAGMTYIWVSALPTLIRPLYSWSGGTPPTAAMQPLQEHGMTIIILAAAIPLLRVPLQRWAQNQPEAILARIALRYQLIRALARPNRVVPFWVGVALRSALTTISLSGMIGTWQDALGVAILAVFLFAGRTLVLPRIPLWLKLMERIPVLLRLGAGVLLAQCISFLVVSALWSIASTESGAVSFRPMLYSAMLSMIVFALLLPGKTPGQQDVHLEEVAP